MFVRPMNRPPHAMLRSSHEPRIVRIRSTNVARTAMLPSRFAGDNTLATTEFRTSAHPTVWDFGGSPLCLHLELDFLTTESLTPWKGPLRCRNGMNSWLRLAILRIITAVNAVTLRCTYGSARYLAMESQDGIIDFY